MPYLEDIKKKHYKKLNKIEYVSINSKWKNINVSVSDEELVDKLEEMQADGVRVGDAIKNAKAYLENKYE
jgi:hypothetical protein